MAVPVRSELVNQILEADRRLRAAGQRWLEERRTLVEGLGRGLPDPARLIGEMSQRLDDRAERLANAVAALVTRRRERLADLGARLPDPRRQQALARERLESPAARLAALLERRRLLIDRRQALKTLERVLESTSYANVLQRGFAVVRGPEGVIARAAGVTPGLALDIEFGDGHAAAVGTGARPARTREPKPRAKRAKPSSGDEPQGSLL